MQAARPAPWAADYVGLPFVPGGRGRGGCDCWGLVVLVYRERFRITLPAWQASADPADRAAVAAEFRQAPARGWRRIDPSSARDGDVALLRVGGAPCHVGVIAGWPWLLHAERGTDAALDRLDGVRWARRFDSLWRHEALG
jgi:cell wall-associated NlpC family hydrolase